MSSTEETPAAATTNEQQSETFMQKMTRMMGNCCSSITNCCSNSKEQVVINKLEMDIASRKKKFGVEYMNLKAKEGTTAEQLEELVDKATEDLKKLHDEVKAQEAKIAENNEKLKKNIKEKPGAKTGDEAEKKEGDDPKPETAPEGEKKEDTPSEDAPKPTEGEETK